MADTQSKELKVREKQEVNSPAEQSTPGLVFTPAVDIFETKKEITLPWYVVNKKVHESKVIQFERLTGDLSTFIAYIGAITAFGAATMALVQTDIKAVLAYSTISQLGFMVLGIGVGAYNAAFMHLITHAVFKACLFLSSL